MNWEALELEIYSATKSVFSKLRSEHSNEDFYTYALYTDSSAMSVAPAANSLQGLEIQINNESNDDDDDDDDKNLLSYYKWSTSEWKYEAWGSIEFKEICRKLRDIQESEACRGTKKSLINSMVLALMKLNEEGFFGEGSERNRTTIFVTITDDDGALDIENKSARLLNPQNVSAEFSLRFTC